MALCEVINLTKYFGGLKAIDDLSFKISEREILGLIGPNGAGKTTFFNLVTGYYPPSAGKIIFNGEDITSLKPYRIASKGLIRTFQSTTLFKEITVLENMYFGFHLALKTSVLGELFNTKKKRQEEKEIKEKSLEILEFMGLADRREEITKNLPHGHQRALGISLALAAGPQLLLLDEPVTGMNPKETEVMIDHIGRISEERKITVMVVEHNMKVVMGICNRIIALNFGTKIAEGTADEIKTNKMVIEAYLGAENEEYDVIGS
jgi:branched-chain amino acid transport system ATP-binding protein